LWHDTTADVHIDNAGRNTNQQVFRALETGTGATADPPELTCFDTAGEAASRTNPSEWVLVGTTTTSSNSCMRGIETTGGAPGSLWVVQTHSAAPSAGSCLEGTVAKETCAAVLSQSGNKLFNLAANAPDDATSGLTNFVYALIYTYETWLLPMLLVGGGLVTTAGVLA
jgi:hypothetical protein